MRILDCGLRNGEKSLASLSSFSSLASLNCGPLVLDVQSAIRNQHWAAFRVLFSQVFGRAPQEVSVIETETSANHSMK
jgi:hypothetical protein